MDPVKVDIRSTFDGRGVQEARREVDDLSTQINKSGAAANDASGHLAGMRIATLSVASAAAVAGLAVSAYAAHQVKLASAYADTAEKLATLAERTGIETRELAQLNAVAMTNDTTVERLAQGLKNLSVKQLEANSGNQQAIALFKALGVEYEDGTGKLRNTRDVLDDVATKFAGMENGAGKNAVAAKLLGRGLGEELIPYLNQGADALKKAREEADKLGITLDADAARAVKEMRDNMKLLELSAQSAAFALGEPLVKSLNEATAAMLRAKREGEGLIGMLGAGIKAGVGQLVMNTDQDNLNRMLELRAGSLGAIASARKELEAGGVSRSRAAFLNRIIDNANSSVNSMQPEIEDLAKRLSDAQPAAPAAKTRAPDVLERAERGGGGGGGGGDPYAAAKSYLLTLQNQLDSASGEASAFDRAVREVTDGTKKWNDELAANALAVAGEIDQVKAAKVALDAYLRTVQEDMAAQKEQIDLLTRRSDAIARANVAAYDEAERIRFETSLLHLNGVEREKVIALKRMERERPPGMEDSEFNRNVAAVQAAIDESGRAQQMVDARRQAQDEIKRLSDDTARSITDAIIVGGKNGFRDLGQLALRTFQNLVLRPLIEPQIRTAAGETVNWVRALQGLFGNGGIDTTQITAAGHAQNLGAAAGAFPMEHSGYGPGDPYGPTKVVSLAAFAPAPRFHSGIGPNERAAIIRKDESVLTPGQMRQLAPVGAQQPMRVEIVNSGAPKEVQSATPRIDVDGAVVRVVLADMARNGPLAQGLSNTFNLRRG